MDGEVKKTPNRTVPQTLLLELAHLCPLKYRINVRSNSNCSIILPKYKGNVEAVRLPLINEASDEGVSDKKYSSDYILLTCYITTKSLPLVPPIRILVPYDYPDTNGFVDCIHTNNSEEDMLPEYSNL